MHINTTFFRQQPLHQLQSWIQHIQKTINPPFPRIRICQPFVHRHFPFIILTPNLHLIRKIKILPGIERRVDIYQINLPLIPLRKQRLHHQQVITPYQPVRLAGNLILARIKETRQVAGRLIRIYLLCGLELKVFG